MFFGCTFISAPGLAEQRVDLELVLALDASSSVDQREYQLQLGGVAAALRDPSVQAAIAAGPLRRIAVNVVIWAKPTDAKQSTGWHLISTSQDAETFAKDIEALPRVQNGGTGIGEGIRASLIELQNSGTKSNRRVIDVSGDGRETFIPLETLANAMSLQQAHQLADTMGVTINGLAVTGDDLELFTYYLEKVRHGPGSFAVPASTYDDFTRAMTAKLLREISVQPVAMR